MNTESHLKEVFMKSITPNTLMCINALVMSFTYSVLSASDMGSEIANMARELVSGQRIFCSDDGRASVVFYLFSYASDAHAAGKTYHLVMPPRDASGSVVFTCPQLFLGASKDDVVLAPIMNSMWGHSRIIIDNDGGSVAAEKLPVIIGAMIEAYLRRRYDDQEYARLCSVLKASTVENKKKK